MALRLRRLTVAILAATLVTLGFGMSPLPASAELTDEQWAAAQERLDYYADQIVGGRDTNEVANVLWFVDMLYDVPTKTITLYTTKTWANASIVQPAAAEGISIVNRVRPKSLNQLLADQRALSDRIEAEGIIDGPNTIDINATSDVQTLSVLTDSEDFDFAAISGADTSVEGERIYEQELSKDVGVPIEIKLDQEAPAQTSRQNDTIPYWGGLGLMPPGGGYCSGGSDLRE